MQKIMILYLKDPNNSTRKLLYLINMFGKVAGYKLTYKKISRFSIYQKQTCEKEMKETIPFTRD
jgi:transposase